METCGFLSTSIFMIFALSPIFDFNSSRMGFIILQGPHHSAEKSTRTGVSLLISSKMNLSLFYYYFSYKCYFRFNGIGDQTRCFRFLNHSLGFLTVNFIVYCYSGFENNFTHDEFSLHLFQFAFGIAIKVQNSNFEFSAIAKKWSLNKSSQTQ